LEPLRRLSDIDVQFISLVDKGANMKRIILKSDDLPETPSFVKSVEILKTDIEKRMVFGIVYSPEETDSQGDIATLEEIEKAAHAFMKNRRIGKVDKNHNTEAGEGYVAESWLTKENDSLFATDAPVGSWAVGIKIEKDETWEEIKKGAIGGLSLMGTATIEQLQKSDEKNIWTLIKEKLGLDDVEKAGRKISGASAKKITDAIAVLNQLLEESTVEKKEDSMTEEEKKALTDEIAKGVKEQFDALKKELNDQFQPIVNKLNDDVKKNSVILAGLKKSNGIQTQDGQETTPEEEKAELEKQGKYKDEKGVVRTYMFT